MHTTAPVHPCTRIGTNVLGRSLVQTSLPITRPLMLQNAATTQPTSHPQFVTDHGVVSIPLLEGNRTLQREDGQEDKA